MPGSDRETDADARGDVARHGMAELDQRLFDPPRKNFGVPDAADAGLGDRELVVAYAGDGDVWLGQPDQAFRYCPQERVALRRSQNFVYGPEPVDVEDMESKLPSILVMRPQLGGKNLEEFASVRQLHEGIGRFVRPLLIHDPRDEYAGGADQPQGSGDDDELERHRRRGLAQLIEQRAEIPGQYAELRRIGPNQAQRHNEKRQLDAGFAAGRLGFCRKGCSDLQSSAPGRILAAKN